MKIIEIRFFVVLLLFSISTNVTSQVNIDSCQLMFMADMIQKKETKNNYWIVAKVDSAGHEFKTLVEITSFKSVFESIKRIIAKNPNAGLNFYKWASSEIINSQNNSIKFHDDYNEDLIIKQTNKNKLKLLQSQRIDSILLKYFDKNRNIKKKYFNWRYELVWYCYENRIVVYADDKKCFYEKPFICYSVPFPAKNLPDLKKF
jgi:hypothetical protein